MLFNSLTSEQRAELWFSKIERDVIARGVFTSVTDLRRKLPRIRILSATRASDRWWPYRRGCHR